MHRTRTKKAAGFTLIELLVVISIIALLIGILLPGLGRANQLAKTTVCLSLQRGMAQNMIGWSNDNDDQIPGVNTTGLSLINNAQNPDLINSLNNPYAPTQNYDWITPIMANDGAAPNRAARFFQAFDLYACPEQRLEIGFVYPVATDPGTGDAVDFFDESQQDHQMPSYLMSGYFQWGGRTLASGGLGAYTFNLVGVPGGPSQTATLPSSYRPRFPQVGDLTAKIAFADGTRWLDATGFTDVDANLAPNLFGAFASAGAMFSGERSYGDAVEGMRGQNLEASYRHSGSLNGAFFDGHAETIDMLKSRNPTYWLPSGSTFLGNQAMEECFKYYDEGETVN